MTRETATRGAPGLVELSNAMVALHRRHFGRGPAAAKSFLAGGLAICALSDPYTSVERTLIEAGQGEHVTKTRGLHRQGCAEDYRREAEAALDAPIDGCIGVANVEPDLCIEIFFLAREPA